MDDESYHPKDDETTSVHWVSRLNFLISDKVTSEMIRSLNIKQIVIFQVANKWARGELGNLIQNQNTEYGWYIYLTGSARTRKSHLLTTIRHFSDKSFSYQGD